MPVMDGIEATQNIRKLSRADAKTVPISASKCKCLCRRYLKGKGSRNVQFGIKPI